MDVNRPLPRLLFFSLFISALFGIKGDAYAQSSSGGGPQESVLLAGFEQYFEGLIGILDAVLFYEVLGFPFVVLWLIIGGIFFTLRLRFINIRLFTHAIRVVRGKYSSPDDPGEVTHFQALSAAVSATVGLGNIAGVAAAVALGGPGAVIWMMVAGLMGMSLKFAEVTLGQKYRHFDERGRVSGGAFRYLREGLAERNLPRLGKVLAAVFAVCCITSAMGGGNMFQANQAVSMLSESFQVFNELDNAISVTLAVAVGVVLIGGIRRIARVAEGLVPFMAIIYVLASLVVLGVNAEQIPEAVAFMFRDAFTGEAVGGGLMGALIMGFRRAAFSNEAGIGSAPIAHAAAKTREPVREGCVGLLEPFIDTVVICFMTGLVITVTGVYSTPGLDGAVRTSEAFGTVIDWFPKVLAVCVVLFAYSTMITWSYYGERCWEYLFGKKLVGLYYVMFCSATYFGGVSDFRLVLEFSDLCLLSMAIPNLIGLYLLTGMLNKEVNEYTRKLKAGAFPVTQG